MTRRARMAPERRDWWGDGVLAVRMAGVHRSFSDRPVLQGIDIDVRAGEFVALLGASGSGKTTILRVLTGLETVDRGDVRVAPVRTVVFQEPRLVQSKRVWRNVSIGQPRGASTRRAALAALDEVGLAGHADAWPATLSGGEAQRVALARALVREPQLLLLDEPFAALDALTRINMQHLVSELFRRHRAAVLFVTHDVQEALLLADRVIVLSEGTISLDIAVGLPRPRRLEHPEFGQLSARLLGELGVTAHAT